MSEQAYENTYEFDEPPRRRRIGWLPLLLAVLILAVFAGVAWYALSNAAGPGGQQLAAFEPPLLKADPEPYKRKPEDPGGMRIPNQDKQVFERILPGPAPQQEERLLPKPEEPVARPVPAPAPPVAETATEEVAPIEPSEAPEQATAEQLATPAPAQPLPPPAVAALPRTPVATASIDTADSTGAAQESEDVAPGTPMIAGDGTPIPMEKPQQLAAVAPAAASPQAAPEMTAVYRLQLAAFRESAQALAAWQQLGRKFPEELQALQPHLVKVDIPGKGTFHRLQAGPFASAEAAETTCQALKARKQDCLIVKPN